ncbi:MAG: hypothetical protein HYV27_19295 [Candidatus Hydrogenedentes bacterium]|nr:hypothetical protein [Candidatus Hydrogenedentota bacterium]
METKECRCPYERVHAVEIRGVRDDVRELKERIERLEFALTRGVMLLVVNLAGVIATLGKSLI